MSENVVRIRVDLEGKTKEMFEAIKNKYNLKNNSEIIRLMIKKTFEDVIEK